MRFAAAAAVVPILEGAAVGADKIQRKSGVGLVHFVFSFIRLCAQDGTPTQESTLRARHKRSTWKRGCRKSTKKKL